MNHEVRALAERVESMQLDEPGAVDTFSRRLARENRWSPAFTARVIDEYRCFLVLLGSAQHPVTPSDAVDQAWHLHLLHSRHYRQFCQQAFGRMAHHGPSRGGSSQRAKYEADYQRTLETYEQTFGREPPPDIWPPVAKRFDSGTAFARVDTAAHWLIRKPRAARAIENVIVTRTGLGAAALLFLLAVGIFSATQVTASGPEFLGFFTAAWLATLVLAFVARSAAGNGKDALPTRELDAYESAYLAGGPVAAVDGAVAVLVAQGSAAFDAKNGTLRATHSLAPHARRVEAAVHAALLEQEDTPLRTLRERAPSFTEAIAASLGELGFVTLRPPALPLALALVAPAAGIGRIVSRLGSEHPIGFLVLLSGLGLVVAWWAFRPASRTPRGDALLSSLRERGQTLATEQSSAELAAAGALPLVVGVFGIGALQASDGDALADLRAHLQQPRPAAGGCAGAVDGGGGGGDGGGDGGGGGCGGGCGGCGGA
jgi:uncharacterized protein (TIGR04222 family)